MDTRRTLGNLSSLLEVVRKALGTTTYRNAYEANNALQSNLERLAQAEQGLRLIEAQPRRELGDEETLLELLEKARHLRTDWDERARDIRAGRLTGGGGGAGMGAPSSSQEEWLRQMQEEDVIAQELDHALTSAGGGGGGGNKKKKGARSKDKPGYSTLDAGDGAFFTKETQRDFKNERGAHGMERGSSLAYLMHPTSEGELQDAVVRDISTMKPRRGGGAGDGRKGAVSPQPGAPVGVAGMYVSSANELDTAASAPSAASAAFRSVETHKNALFGALPPAVLVGPCDVVPVANSPLVELHFHRPTPDADGNELRCHVTTYRVVVAALWRGPPQPVSTAPAPAPPPPPSSSSSAAGDAKVQPAGEQPKSQDASVGAEDEGNRSEDESDERLVVVSSESESDGGGDEAISGEGQGGGWAKSSSAVRSRKAQDMITRSGGTGGRNDAAMGPNAGDTVDDYDVLQELSQQLVDKYALVDDAEEAEAFFLSTGRDLPQGIIRNDLTHLLRVSTATWCILMCHGGYFAGAVFENTRPLVHKAFHRYVVRKKQGGKQSSHDKGGGSMSSAGGQIRRHHELKWKATVRDILVAWREYIDRAWLILYVAPGPENRSILTDFADLPASMGGGRGSEQSPVSIKDPRVRSVPLTTHRPTFKEVQRVFDTVSRCTVRLVEKQEQEQEGAPAPTTSAA